jgi:hypothetical protein
MTYPAFDLSRVADAEDMPTVAVTCVACGCRLDRITTDGESVWRHFSPMGGRDARGDRVACVDLPHDAKGRALAPVPA